jgi:molybdenum cofactor cytidylyltransferase
LPRVARGAWERPSNCSITAAGLAAVDPTCEVLVLMLGDQPRVGPGTVSALLEGLGEAALAACAYDDGRGHPLAFDRSLFGELTSLHRDKGVWKLTDRLGDRVADVPIDGPIPLDVDTWEDYQAVGGEMRDLLPSQPCE